MVRVMGEMGSRVMGERWVGKWARVMGEMGSRVMGEMGSRVMGEKKVRMSCML